MANTRRRSGGSQATRSVPAVTRRSKVVWGTLLAGMTVVGGLLSVLDRGGMPRLDGLSLPPLVAAAGPSSVEVVFNTRAALDHQRWQSIVIHHSGSAVGSPATIEAKHKAQNFKGLGYHFVIGNGNTMSDGELYVGYRWLDQLPGAHAAGPEGDWYNRRSIGICLIGDGQRRPFTDAQVRRLVQLVSALARELGIPKDRIVLHSDVAEVDDPGTFFPAAALREQLSALR
jgi:N-acetyl-anhydromuramyl-L-alanine amidase AmpD